MASLEGGFTGQTTAYFLKKAQPGTKVVLLEAKVIGFGASGRNAGFSMTTFGLTHTITALRFGKQRAVEAHNSNCRVVNLLRGLVGTPNGHPQSGEARVELERSDSAGRGPNL